MTRTGALLWKEGRDHRAALIVFAALVPIVSWPVQRWIFKFGEPDWTWKWLVPLCVGLALAVVAADSFAGDLATSRMTSFAALPTPLRRHFGARTLFLALVAVVMGAWTWAVNVAIVGVWGVPGAAARQFNSVEPAFTGLLMCAAGAGAVLVFSTLGVGGFRAVIGGALLAAVAYYATDYAGERLFPPPQWSSRPSHAYQVEWAVAAGVLFLAAYAGFVGSRASATSRQRGAVFAGAILVTAFGVPAATTGWHAWRSLSIHPGDADARFNHPVLSPDGRYLAIAATKEKPFPCAKSWIVRIEDGVVFDWPRRNEYAQGWSVDGLVWTLGAHVRREEWDLGRLSRPESGESVGAPVQDTTDPRIRDGLWIGPRWAQWLRWGYEPSKTPKGAGKLVYAWSLYRKDSPGAKRLVIGKSVPTPTARVGEALYVNEHDRLTLIDLADGVRRYVADDVEGIGGVISASSDGRWFVVRRSKTNAVLDSTTWRPVLEFDRKASAFWCGGSESRAVLQMADADDGRLTRLVEFPSGRAVVPEAGLALSNEHGCVQALADGRFVASSRERLVSLLDADGKFIRRLFPPEER